MERKSDNKLGLGDLEASEMADRIVEYKASLLNEKVTFGCDNYDLEYLCKLHNFLFGDVYPNTEMISERYQGSDLSIIENKIAHLFSLIAGKEDKEAVKDELKDLIDMQIFDDGNNRTFVIFAKQIIDTWSITDKKYYEDLSEYLVNGGRRL